MTDMLQTSRDYLSRGFSVIPVPYQSKNPGFTGWQNMRLTEADLPNHFNCKPQNIGFLAGGPSGWIVDIDLDHPSAVEMADRFLPATAAVFGRASKPRSHRLFRSSSPIVTKQFRLGKTMIVEIRSTGLQTVLPPSVHESGEAILWESENAEPAVIDPSTLTSAVEALYEAVCEKLGETPEKAARRKEDIDEAYSNESENWRRALSRMLRIRKADGHDGSRRLLALSCRAVEHDLTDDEAIRCIRACETKRPFPKEWSDDDIVKRIRSAEGKCTRGEALHQHQAVRIELGADEHRVIDETIGALRNDSDIFQRGGLLVRVRQLCTDVERSEPVPISIQPLPIANLRDRISKHAKLIKFDAGGFESHAHPPAWLVGGVDARGEWPGIRELAGVASAPFLRRDGSICQYAGYDCSSGVLLWPSGDFRRRRDALESAQWRCERCGCRDEPLQVHHLHYQSLGNEQPDDLQALCESCHAHADDERREDERDDRFERRFEAWAESVCGPDWMKRDVEALRDRFRRWLEDIGDL